MNTSKFNHSDPKTAIVLLSHLMDEHGRLDNESISRADLAAKYLKQHKASYIITSGWRYRKDCTIPIGEACAKYLVEAHHVPEEQLLVDTNARDTVGDALFVGRNLVSPLDIKSLIIVTSDYHVERTHIIFKNIFTPKVTIKVVGAETTTKGGQQVTTHEQASIEAFQRTFEGINFSDENAVYNRLRQDHPYYNGVVHTQIPPLS